MAYPGQAPALQQLGDVVTLFMTQLFHLLRDLQTGPLRSMLSEGTDSQALLHSLAKRFLFCSVLWLKTS